MPDFKLRKIALVGVGLIGGSFGLALKQAAVVEQVLGWDLNCANLDKALELGIIDVAAADMQAAVTDADVVVLALPVRGMEAAAREALKYMRSDAVLTDTGSVKGTLVKAIEPLAYEAGIAFVPGHPISGTEKSGPEAAFADLYRGKRCILTPTDATSRAALDLIVQLWSSIGSEVVIMDVVKHDRVLAAISHLPHMIAYALVNSVSNYDQYAENILEYSAGGFLDFTRIASSDPVMWRDIAMENHTALLEMIEQFETFLAELKGDIAGLDADRLEKFFRQSKLSRDAIIRPAAAGAGRGD